MKSMLKSLMSVAAAALALTSCSTDTTEDVMPNGGSKTLVVNASIDQTRTVMADNHVDLKWAAGDTIYLYIGDKATKTDAKKIVPLTGSTITGVTYNDGNTVYANYSLDNYRSNGVAQAEIYIKNPQKQSEADVFAGENLPMVAKGTIQGGKVDLKFQPVGCVLVFNVYGPAGNEKIKSIKFETSVGCCGFQLCNLTAAELGYKAHEKYTSATVTLTTPATIGASKPSDTKVGENQIYLVVAQAEYPAGSKFTVTTDANNAYTFTTTTPLDCSQTTARVVNLNLAKSTELKPVIEVPTVPEQPSTENTQLHIGDIVFKNITSDQKKSATVGVFSDKELTQELGTDSWLKIPNTGTVGEGYLNCEIGANTTTDPRTAYIGIKCKDESGNIVAQAAIAVKQVGAGSTPAENVVATYVPEDMGYINQEKVTRVSLNGDAVTLVFDKGTNSNGNVPKYYTSGTALRCYVNNTITVSSPDKISKIVITRGTKDESKTLNLTSGGGTLSDDIWTGESNGVVLTPAGTIHIASMEITYVESNEPKIIVPTVADKQPAEGSTLTIQDIVFKNIDVSNVTTGVYSNAELTESTNVAWLTIANADLANGTLSCNVAANDGAERTAYIGIKYGEIVKSIAVTQIGAADPGILFKEDFNTLTGTAEWKGWSPKFSAATKVYEAEGAIKLGSSKFIGSITTQELNLLAPVTLEFKVKEYSGKAGNIDISVSNGTAVLITKNVSYSASDDFQSVSVSLDAATSTSTITIATTSGNKRAYIDDIVVKVTE